MTRAHPLLINDLTMDCGQRAPLEAAAGVAASLYETSLSQSVCYASPWWLVVTLVPVPFILVLASCLPLSLHALLATIYGSAVAICRKPGNMGKSGPLFGLLVLLEGHVRGLKRQGSGSTAQK